MLTKRAYSLLFNESFFSQVIKSCSASCFFHFVVQYDICPKGKILDIPLEYRLKVVTHVSVSSSCIFFLALEKKRTGRFLERCTHESLRRGKCPCSGKLWTGLWRPLLGLFKSGTCFLFPSLYLTRLLWGSKPREYTKNSVQSITCYTYCGH